MQIFEAQLATKASLVLQDEWYGCNKSVMTESQLFVVALSFRMRLHFPRDTFKQHASSCHPLSSSSTMPPAQVSVQ